jgi:cytochrome c-type biogenesis protein CcmH/NrfG
VLTGIVRDRPESYRSQWLLGAQFLRSDRPRSALHYEAAYRIYPRDSEFLAAYAEFLFTEQRYRDAVRIAEEAYRLHPEVLGSTSLLAWAYLAAGQFQPALEVIQQVEKLEAPLTITMPMRAYAYERLGLPERAVAAWRVALGHALRPGWREWSYLARALALAGRADEALAATRRARVLTADSAAIAAIARLGAAVRAGCYRAATAQDPAGTRSCDPVGHLLQQPAQSANSSQNATTTSPASRPGHPLEIR